VRRAVDRGVEAPVRDQVVDTEIAPQRFDALRGFADLLDIRLGAPFSGQRGGEGIQRPPNLEQVTRLLRGQLRDPGVAMRVDRCDREGPRRLGPEPVETIVRAAIRPVADSQTRGAWYRDWRLTAFDGTTFTVPDSEENDREFGRPGSGRGEGKTAYPQVQAACLVELGTHAVFDARLDAYAAAETMLIEEMFPALRMLVLADRHVYSFHRWRRAAATGADLLWRVPRNLTLRPVEYLPDGSYIAEVIPPAKSGMVSFRVRVIEYKLPDTQDGKDELYRLDSSPPSLTPSEPPRRTSRRSITNGGRSRDSSSRSRVFN
jgi:hypothetical protein